MSKFRPTIEPRPHDAHFAQYWQAVATQYAKRYAVVPLLVEEPIGVMRLAKLTQTG